MKDFIEALKLIVSSGKAKEEPMSSAVFKKIGDDWRMLGIASNDMFDREEEKFPEKAHEEYAEWTKETGFKPALTIFHLPMLPHSMMKIIYMLFGDNIPVFQKMVDAAYKDFSIGQVEYVAVVNGFLVVDAKIFEHAKGIVERISTSKQEPGMSHAFILLEKSGNILNGYRSYEFTILPKMRAANFFTLPMFRRGKKNMSKLNQKDREYIDELYGEGFSAQILKLTEDAKDRLGNFNLKSFLGLEETEEETKEVTETETEETKEVEEVEDKVEDKQVDEEAEEEEEDEAEDEMKSVDTAEIVAAVVKALNMEGLQEVISQVGKDQAKMQETIAELQTQVTETATKTKELEKSEDEKIAEQITPMFNWGKDFGIHAASTSEETVVSDEVVEEVVVPTVEVGNPNNMLQQGFWDRLGSN